MKVLQLDVDNITYTPVKPEARLYDEVERKEVSINDVLVVMISVEKGDTNETAAKALSDISNFMGKLKRRKLLIYPYAHLSNNLAPPEDALEIINYMTSNAPEGIETLRGPFGWNKKLKLDIKGHPLAEQSRSYGPSGIGEKEFKKAKPTSVNTSIVKKSSWAGLPDTDHRTIGEKLDLYSFQEVSPSMVYWHPKGFIIFNELLKFIREKQEKYGYKEISTPIIANTALWHVSGHISHYRENMFVFDTEMGELGLKPMNCPSSILIYKSRKWSYKDLPFKTAIFDKLYRKEVSGALTGLFRVQEMTQNDGHIFLSEEQLEAEISEVIKLVKETYETFKMRFVANLSTMPDNHMGSEETWEKATDSLKKAMESNGIDYRVKEKDGAFYGPKIDFDVIDAMGRSWTFSTIQVDYQQPLQFKLEYVAEDGKERTPIMVHRAILGSLERTIAVLIEHYQGKFPTWLSPVQVRIISVSEHTSKYAQDIHAKMAGAGIRAELETSDKTMQNKLREAILEKVPYIIILGQKESESGSITVRSRSGNQKSLIKAEDFISQVSEEIRSRSNGLMY